MLKILIKRPFNYILRVNNSISELYKKLNSKKFFNILFTFLKYSFLTYILVSILASVFFKISLSDVFYYHLHILNTGLLQRAYSLFSHLFEKLYDYFDFNNVPDNLNDINNPKDVQNKVQNKGKDVSTKIENSVKSNPLIQQKIEDFESLRKQYAQPLSKWKFDNLKAQYLDGRITFEQFYNLLHEAHHSEATPQSKIKSNPNIITDTLQNHPIYSFLGIIVVGGIVVYLFSNGSLDSASGVFVNYFTLLTSWVTGHETITPDTNSDTQSQPDIDLTDRRTVAERLDSVVKGESSSPTRPSSPALTHKSEEQEEWGKLSDERKQGDKTPLIVSSHQTPEHSRPSTPVSGEFLPTPKVTSSELPKDFVVTPKGTTSELPKLTTNYESGSLQPSPTKEYDNYFHNPLAIEETRKFFDDYGDALVTNTIISSDELKDYQSKPRGVAPGFREILLEDLDSAINKNSAERILSIGGFKPNDELNPNVDDASSESGSESDGSEDDGLPKINNMNE